MNDYVIHFARESAYATLVPLPDADGYNEQPRMLLSKTIRNVTTWEVRDGWALFWCGPARSTPAFMFPGYNISRIELLESKGEDND